MSLWNKAALCAALTFAGPALAEDPISAIDWLSDVIRVPSPVIPREPASSPAETETIAVTPLEDVSVDAVGLLPLRVTGLPRDFWADTPSAELARLLSAQRPALPRPAQRLLKQLLLAELDPPADSSADHLLFLARIDTLLRFGALQEAQALVERAGPTDDPEIFRRWFDMSLLLGDENRACAAMRAAPDIAPTFSARIFCLARGGDWPAAALSLETARALGYVTEAEDLLMARFLDPELFEGEPIATPPRPLTPLSYKMLSALAEAPPASTLPLAFNHALLSQNNGWKPRIEAAERLVRTGGITPSELFSIYNEREPAASGGVWDRVSAVQDLDVALLAGETGLVAERIVKADTQMRNAGLEPAFAEYYGPRAARLALSGEAQAVAERLVLQTASAPSFARRVHSDLYSAIAAGKAPEQPPDDLDAAAIASIFDADGPRDPDFSKLIEKGNRGEAALRALATLSRTSPESDDVAGALGALRDLGFERTTRESALAFLLSREDV
jgi:hypothetical protein